MLGKGEGAADAVSQRCFKPWHPLPREMASNKRKTPGKVPA